MIREGIDIQCFSEGKQYKNEMYADLLLELKQNPDVLVVYPCYFKFVITGLLIIKNRPVVIFPKNYFIPETTQGKKSEAVILLKTLMRYRSEREHPSNEVEMLFGGDAYSSGSIASSIFIMDDYINNGAIRRKIKLTSTTRTGRIDWVRTINKTIPYINHNRPAYIKPLMKSSIIDYNNIITLIHTAIAKECIEMWSWVSGYKFDYDLQELPVNIPEAISVLREELYNIYDQHDTAVLRALIEYLEAKNGTENSNKLEILATPYFYYVWEFICGHIFSNQYFKLSRFIPQPEWNSPFVKSTISQRPDILFLDKNAFYIFDAKYYDYTHNLPGWYDIVKQMFYKYTIEKLVASKNCPPMLSHVDRFINVFIMPENSIAHSTYVGCVEVEGVSELGKIYSFSINTRQAMESYASGTSSSLKEDLTNQLENIIL